jgi:hypothetical protein
VVSGGGSCPGNPSFDVQVTGNNPNPSSFSLTDGGSQSVTLAPGSFTVREAIASGFTPSFSGNCNGAAGSGEATGNIAAGQQITCTITNTIGPAPLPGVLLVNKVCVIPGGGFCQGSFNIQVTGNNPQPTSFSLSNGNSQAVGLESGTFTVTEGQIPGFTTSFSGDCMQTASGSQATGTMNAGQHLRCTITNTAAPVPAIGTLIVNKVCVPLTGGGPCQDSFNIQVSGSNPQPSSFSLSNGRSQSVTLGSGTFSVVETPQAGFTTSFSGACTQSGSTRATGNIAAGQQQTCTITNTAIPSTILFNVDCSICTPGDKVITITGNNPRPPSFLSGDQISQLVTLDPGNYEITVSGVSPADIRFSGNCGGLVESNGPVTQFSVSGTISAGETQQCRIHYDG